MTPFHANWAWVIYFGQIKRDEINIFTVFQEEKHMQQNLLQLIR